MISDFDPHVDKGFVLVTLKVLNTIIIIIEDLCLITPFRFVVVVVVFGRWGSLIIKTL